MMVVLAILGGVSLLVGAFLDFHILVLAAALVMYATVLILMASNLLRTTAEPINRMNKTVAAITDGKMDVNLRADAAREAGEVGVLESSLAKLAISHHNFNGDLERFVARVKTGETNATLEARNYPGGLCDIAMHINAVVEYMHKVNTDVLGAVDGFTRGSLAPPAVANHPKAADSVERAAAVLQALRDDLAKISSAVKAGQFNVRTTGMYAGDWTKMASDINAMADAPQRPLTDIISALERIESGVFSSSISNSLTGEYARVKSALEKVNTTFAGNFSELSSIVNDISFGRTTVHYSQQYRGTFQQMQSAINAVVRSYDRLAEDLKRAQANASLAKTTPTGVAKLTPTAPRPAITAPITAAPKPLTAAARTPLTPPAKPAGGGVHAPPPLPVTSGRSTIPSGAHEYNRKDFGKYK